MAHGRALLLALVLGLLAGCAAKDPDPPKSMNDVKLPPGQQFGYKPK